MTKDDYNNLQSCLNEEIYSCLDSGIVDDYVYSLRHILNVFGLKEVYNFDSWIDKILRGTHE